MIPDDDEDGTGSMLMNGGSLCMTKKSLLFLQLEIWEMITELSLFLPPMEKSKKHQLSTGFEGSQKYCLLSWIKSVPWRYN